jgi:uncharacterized iron-regulated membrane protein
MITRQRVTTLAAIFLSLAAVGAPGAGARPVDVVPASDHASPAAVYSRPDKQLTSVSSPVTSKTPPQRQPVAAVVRVETPQTGFDWGDAGIGAAGGLALAMLGLGAALVISRRRPARTRQSTALPT